MSSAGTLAAGDYTKKTVEMAEARSDFCMGFISTSRLSEVGASVHTHHIPHTCACECTHQCKAFTHIQVRQTAHRKGAFESEEADRNFVLSSWVDVDAWVLYTRKHSCKDREKGVWWQRPLDISTRCKALRSTATLTAATHCDTLQDALQDTAAHCSTTQTLHAGAGGSVAELQHT